MNITWEPNGWNQTQKDELLSFWTQRYAQNPFNLSNQQIENGWNKSGFFDAVKVMDDINAKYPGQEYRQESEYQLANNARRAEWKGVMTLARGSDRERLNLQKHAETASKNYAEERTEEHRKALQDTMGTLISFDADHHNPIANPDRDLTKPLTYDENMKWLHRDGQQASLSEIAKAQEGQEGQYKNGQFFTKEAPEVMNRGEFIPLALETKVAQENAKAREVQSQAKPALAQPAVQLNVPEKQNIQETTLPQKEATQQKQEPKVIQDPAQTFKASTPSVEHKAIEAKDYFIQKAPNLEELGKKLDREETSKEKEGKGQMQSVQKAFTQKETEGRAGFSPKAEHAAWAKKVEMADRANTERQAQLKNETSPKLRTQEELKKPVMAAEKSRLEGYQLKALDRFMGRTPDTRRPPQMNSAERTEKPQAQSVHPNEPMKSAPQVKSLSEVGVKVDSNREIDNRRPPQMNSAKAEAKKPEGQSQEVKRDPPQMNPAKPLSQVKAHDPVKAPPTMAVPPAQPMPTRSRSGYDR